MNNTFRIAAVAGLFALCAWSDARAEEAPRVLTLSQAVELGLENGPGLEISAQGVVGAKARVETSRARRLPRLMLESNLLVWDDSLEFDLAIPGLPPLPEGAMTVRDRVTSTTSVTIAQPLSPLYPLTKLVKVEEAGLGAARADHQVARLDAAFRAAAGYLQLLLARAGSEIAKKSVAQLEAQLARAKVLSDAGVLERVDVMRLESALASIRQQSIQAEAAVLVAQDALALATGFPSGTTIEPVDNLPESPGSPPWQPNEAVDLARKNRPELLSARMRARQARAGEAATMSKLFPNLVGIATYQHNEGMGTFQPANAWFVGLTLKWDVWDFGGNWHALEEAGAKAKQARLAVDLRADQLTLEVRKRAIEAKTAHDALGAARTGLTAAEEALRLQTARFDRGAATTTDLLDAETDVMRARLGYATTRYAYFLRLVLLARAVGELPAAALAGGGARKDELGARAGGFVSMRRRAMSIGAGGQ